MGYIVLLLQWINIRKPLVNATRVIFHFQSYFSQNIVTISSHKHQNVGHKYIILQLPIESFPPERERARSLETET